MDSYAAKASKVYDSLLSPNHVNGIGADFRSCFLAHCFVIIALICNESRVGRASPRQIA